MPDDMRIAAYEIEARLLRWGDSSTAGRTITLELDPDAGEQHPFRHYSSGAKHGQRFRLLFASISDDESAPVPPAPEVAPARLNNPQVKDPSKSERAKDSYALKTERERAVVRASLLCKDPQFQKWMCNNTSYAEAPTESITTFLLRDHLGIKSRSEIGYDERAYKAFLDLEYQFDVFTGKKAGPR